MVFLKILDQIKSLISSHANIEFAFGQPTQVEDMTVIPVARISICLGAGGGKGGNKPVKKEGTSEECNKEKTASSAAFAEGEGGGGGGRLKTEPLGIYTIRNGKIRFHAVIAFSDVVKLITILGLLTWRLSKLRKQRMDKKK